MKNKEADAMVDECLKRMEQDGLVRRFARDGKEFWELTPKGQAMADLKENQGNN